MVSDPLRTAVDRQAGVMKSAHSRTDWRRLFPVDAVTEFSSLSVVDDDEIESSSTRHDAATTLELMGRPGRRAAEHGGPQSTLWTVDLAGMYNIPMDVPVRHSPLTTTVLNAKKTS